MEKKLTQYPVNNMTHMFWVFAVNSISHQQPEKPVKNLSTHCGIYCLLLIITETALALSHIIFLYSAVYRL